MPGHLHGSLRNSPVNSLCTSTSFRDLVLRYVIGGLNEMKGLRGINAQKVPVFWYNGSNSIVFSISHNDPQIVWLIIALFVRNFLIKKQILSRSFCSLSMCLFLAHRRSILYAIVFLWVFSDLPFLFWTFVEVSILSVGLFKIGSLPSSLSATWNLRVPIPMHKLLTLSVRDMHCLWCAFHSLYWCSCITIIMIYMFSWWTRLCL